MSIQAKELRGLWESTRTLVPNLFVEDNSFPWMRGWGRGWSGDDSRALHLLYTLFLSLLHRLHLRSSGVRPWRLGTPVLDGSRTGDNLISDSWPPDYERITF